MSFHFFIQSISVMDLKLLVSLVTVTEDSKVLWRLFKHLSSKIEIPFNSRFSQTYRIK